MNRILVLITLSGIGIDTIKSTPELPKRESEFVQRWKEEGLLESFFISLTKESAVLIFKNMDVIRAKEFIATLPYFPYMASIEYHNLNKQF